MSIHIKRGGVYVSKDKILKTSLGSCVSVCLYHPEYLIGGMNHIFGSRRTHGSRSGKFIRTEKEGYFYADNAVPRLLTMLKEAHPSIRNMSLHMAVVGGFNNEGAITETIEELGLKIVRSQTKASYLLRTRHDSRYKFKLKGYCINRRLYRNVNFDIKNRRVIINRTNPQTKTKDSIILSL
jgi:chemotaxis receptor (MCP) glutamine deamidase CheD